MQLDGVDIGICQQVRQLARRHGDKRTDDDEAAAFLRRGEIPCAQKRAGLKADERRDDGSRSPEEKLFPLFHGPEDGESDDVHVASIAGIDDAETAIAARAQRVRNGLRPSPADIFDGDGADIVSADGPAHLLADVVLQVRRDKPEGGVLRIGGLGRRYQLVALLDVVDIVDREAPPLEKGRHAERHRLLPPECRFEGFDLGPEVAAQGRVASADDHKPAARLRSGLRDVPRNLAIELDRLASGQASRVGEDEKDRAALELRPQGLDGPRRQDRDVMDCLATRRVVVHDDEGECLLSRKLTDRGKEVFLPGRREASALFRCMTIAFFTRHGTNGTSGTVFLP